MKPETRGLAYWLAAVDGRDTLSEEHYATLRTHPRFIEACKYMEKASLDLSANNSQMARTMGDMSGVLYGVFTLYMDARGGLTRSSIEQFCQENGLASPGRSAAFLFQLRMRGYVTPDPTPRDKRVRRYIPAPAMTESVRAVFLCALRAFSLIEPEIQKLVDRIAEPEVFKALVLNVGKDAAVFVKRGDRTLISLFAERNFGMQILYHIVSAASEDDEYPPKGLVRTSVAELTKRFPVSRSHVVKLLRDAEREGLLRRHADDGKSYLTEKLREALMEFNASMMIGHAANAYRTLRSIEHHTISEDIHEDRARAVLS